MRYQHIPVVLCAAFLLVNMASALEVVEIYSIDSSDPGFSLFEQSIFADKSTYIQGEVAEIQGIQAISAYCDDITAKYTLKKGLKTITTAEVSLGRGGYMEAYYRLWQPTEKLEPGKYKIQSVWICDGLEIGEDGFLDSNTKPEDPFEFRVVEPDDDDDAEPPEQECSKSCSAGHRLVNPNSASCFCEPNFVIGDGVCDLGESLSSSPDCDDQLTCQEDQIIVEGLCINPNQICLKDGGTKLCDGQAVPIAINKIVYALGVIGLITGGFVLFKK